MKIFKISLLLLIIQLSFSAENGKETKTDEKEVKEKNPADDVDSK